MHISIVWGKREGKVVVALLMWHGTSCVQLKAEQVWLLALVISLPVLFPVSEYLPWQWRKNPSCGNCAQSSTEFTPMIECCVQGSIKAEAARVELLLEWESQRN